MTDTGLYSDRIVICKKKEKRKRKEKQSVKRSRLDVLSTTNSIVALYEVTVRKSTLRVVFKKCEKNTLFF